MNQLISFTGSILRPDSEESRVIKNKDHGCVNENTALKREEIKHGHHGYDSEVNFRTARDYVLIRMGLQSAEAVLPVASKINQLEVRPSAKKRKAWTRFCGGTVQEQLFHIC